MVSLGGSLGSLSCMLNFCCLGEVSVVVVVSIGVSGVVLCLMLRWLELMLLMFSMLFIRCSRCWLVLVISCMCCS